MRATLSSAGAGQLRRLLGEGIDVNAADGNGYTALHYAAMARWDEDLVGKMVVLLDAGAGIEATLHEQHRSGWTPLMLAAWEGRASHVRRLIAYGANIEAADHEKRRPLMLACMQGREALAKVQALLAAGARVDVRSGEGKTPLDYALERAEMVGDGGAAGNLVDVLLHITGTSNHDEALRVLARLGAETSADQPRERAEVEQVVRLLRHASREG